MSIHLCPSGCYYHLAGAAVLPCCLIQDRDTLRQQAGPDGGPVQVATLRGVVKRICHLLLCTWFTLVGRPSNQTRSSVCLLWFMFTSCKHILANNYTCYKDKSMPGIRLYFYSNTIWVAFVCFNEYACPYTRTQCVIGCHVALEPTASHYRHRLTSHMHAFSLYTFVAYNMKYRCIKGYSTYIPLTGAVTTTTTLKMPLMKQCTPQHTITHRTRQGSNQRDEDTSHGFQYNPCLA